MSEPSDAGTDGGLVSSVRAELRARRRDLDPALRRSATDVIVRRLLDLEELSAPPDTMPPHVALFAPTDGEVDLTTAAPELRERGWRTFLPVTGANRSLSFAAWEANDVLLPGRFGVPVPAERSGGTAVGSVAVVVVPCVGVDPRGNRIGFGAGYYDRALAARAPSTVLIAPTFDFQVVDELRPEPWDIPVDVIVTERRVIPQTGVIA